MADEIKPGDRAMLVWGCCPLTRRYIGRVFLIDAIFTPVTDYVHIKNCGCMFGSMPLASHSEGPNTGIPVTWLRKMPPDDEQKTKEKEKELVD